MDRLQPPGRSFLLVVHAKLPLIGFCTSSAMLAIINMIARSLFPFPSTLTALQCLSCSMFVFTLHRFKIIRLDPLCWKIVQRFLPTATFLFMSTLSSIQLAKHANAEALFILQSTTTVLMAFAEPLSRRGRSRSSLQTFVALLILLGGAVAYVINREQIILDSLIWAGVHELTVILELLCVKQVVMAGDLKPWGFLLYINIVPLGFLLIFQITTGETKDAWDLFCLTAYSKKVATIVLLSCLVSSAFRFFGYGSLKSVSATTFSVADVLCQLPSLVIQEVFWERSASPRIMALLFCLIGSMLYWNSEVADDTNSALPVISQDESEGSARDHLDA